MRGLEISSVAESLPYIHKVQGLAPSSAPLIAKYVPPRVTPDTIERDNEKRDTANSWQHHDPNTDLVDSRT